MGCMETSSHEALSRAIAQYPTLKAFSDAMEVRYQVVQQWLVNGVPAEYCPLIEKLTGERCEDLNSKVDWAFIRSNKPRRSKRHQASAKN
jgi:DNA-binding transcriptional regulator YdaS (Cro superfamily)